MYATRAALPSPLAPTQPSISSSCSDVCVAAALRISVLLEAQAPRSGASLPLLSPAEQAASILAVALFGGSRASLVADEPALEEGMRRCYRFARPAHDLWFSSTMRTYVPRMTRRLLRLCLGADVDFPPASRSAWIQSLLVLRNAGVPPVAVEPPAAPRPTEPAAPLAGDPTAETLLALAQHPTLAEHGAHAGPSSAAAGAQPWPAPPEFQFDFDPSALLPFTLDGGAADLDFGFAWDFMNAAGGFD